MIDDLLSYIQNTIIRYITCTNGDTITEIAENAIDNNISIRDSRSNNSGNMDSSVNRNGPPSIVLNVEQFIRDVEDRPAIWNRNYHCNKLFMEQTWDELSALHKLPKQTLKTKWKGLRDNFRVEYKRIPRNENGDFLIPPETHDSKWTNYHALLFLTDHMRHRQPKIKSESYYFNTNYSAADSEEYEHTLVEPDLTNGLIHLPEHDDSTSQGILQMNGMAVNMGTLQAPECSSNDSALYSNNGNSSGYAACGMGSNGLVPTLTIKRKRQSEELEDIKPNIDQSVDPDDDYHYLLSLHPYMKQLNAAQKLRIRTKIQKIIFKELYKEDIEEAR